ncbi:virulence protein [[Mycoplasma] gypis]|uniref:Virulence protein n=1 Tax=[Mycoplasma] gypis TaxID=92404 RepID=A0ABZ2RTL4_9BACT|nr:virulence protein [[Mycoplasma] gypis]MBN0919596.1 virulence protein [[Mycoplasma] gypis]
MYGMVFYLDKKTLIAEYGENYHDGYEEIRSILRRYGFHWLSNSFYYSRSLNNLANMYRAIRSLKRIDWFKKSLISFNVFKMDDLSDFTELMKDEWNPSVPMK